MRKKPWVGVALLVPVIVPAAPAAASAQSAETDDFSTPPGRGSPATYSLITDT